MNIVSTTVTETQQKTRYDFITIVFHWLTALLVLVLFGTALSWTYAPRDWGLRWLQDVHVSLGIALVAVVVGRIFWRLAAGRHLAQKGTLLTKTLSRIVHLALYGLLIIQAALGIGLQWSSGEGLSFFGLFDFSSPIAENRELGDQLEVIHNVVAWTIMGVVFGHAAAAILHHFIARDGVLERMAPSLFIAQD